MQLVDVYKRAAALIRRGHVKGANAANASGHRVSARSDDACAWCLIGAINAASGSNCALYGDALIAAGRSVPGRVLSQWNDAPERTAEEVAAFLESLA